MTVNNRLLQQLQVALPGNRDNACIAHLGTDLNIEAYLQTQQFTGRAEMRLGNPDKGAVAGRSVDRGTLVISRKTFMPQQRAQQLIVKG